MDNVYPKMTFGEDLDQLDLDTNVGDIPED